MPIISAILLTLAFPRSDLSFLAWIALIPLLRSIQTSSSKFQSFKRGYVFGIAFFLMVLAGVRFVTMGGYIALCAYLAIFPAIFALGAYPLLANMKKPWGVLGVPCLWVVMEWGRTEMPVLGFGFNALAFSQQKNLDLILSANLLGMYGISFLICLINVALLLLISRSRSISTWVMILFTGLLMSANLWYGKQATAMTEPAQVLDLAVIQGNIDQNIKWLEETRAAILEKYLTLSGIAAAERPDLIIWPEAAFPGFFNLDADRTRVLDFAKKYRIPMLIGALHSIDESEYTNAAYLVDVDGQIQARYDKMSLVPFGEFVPFGHLLDFLKPLADSLGVGDFSPGTEDLIMELQQQSPDGNLQEGAEETLKQGSSPISVLICFEDSFPGLARKRVLKGAQALVVMTNDAWFGSSAIAFHHLQASVFRAIEVGVPVIRAANTGISGFISPLGEFTPAVSGAKGESISITGHRQMQIPLRKSSTFYIQRGYLLPWMMLLIFGVSFLLTREQKS